MRTVVQAIVAGLMFVAGAFLVYAITAHYLADHAASETDRLVAWGMAGAVIAAALGVAYLMSERRWAAAIALGLIAASVDGFMTHRTIVTTADTLAARSAPASEARRKRDAARDRVRDAEAALQRALDRQAVGTAGPTCGEKCKADFRAEVATARAERDRERIAFDSLPLVSLQTAAADMTGLTDTQLSLIGIALKAVGANVLPAVLIGFAAHIALGLALGPAASIATASPKRTTSEPVEPVKLVEVQTPAPRRLPRPVASHDEARIIVNEFAAQRIVSGPRRRVTVEALWSEFSGWQSARPGPLVPLESFGPAIVEFCEAQGCVSEPGVVIGIGLKRVA